MTLFMEQDIQRLHIWYYKDIIQRIQKFAVEGVIAIDDKFMDKFKYRNIV